MNTPPNGMAWDHFLDLRAGRRTCGDSLCPDPYCFMDRDEDTPAHVVLIDFSTRDPLRPFLAECVCGEFARSERYEIVAQWSANHEAWASMPPW